MKTPPFVLGRVFAGVLLMLTVGPLSASSAPAAAAAPAGGHEAPAAGHGAVIESPFTDEEKALVFDPALVKLDENGQALVWLGKEPLTVAHLLALTPWDLMHVAQALTHQDLPLRRFGQGDGDELTEAWRQRLAAFAVGFEHPAVHHTEDPFDLGLVVWDPGYLQWQNEWGQWYITLARRDIVQRDIATLSPLEVQQAVEVLTGRTYPVEFVLEHLESFRAQITVHQRVVEAAGHGEAAAGHGAAPAAAGH